MTDAAIRPRTPLVVWALAAAIVVTYVAFWMSPTATQDAIDRAFALSPRRYHADGGDPYQTWYEAVTPFFAHAFLHVTWWHAALNAFFLFVLGRFPAMWLGWWRFLIVFLASVVLGALAFLALNWNASAEAVGASAGVCGVFSAYYLSVRPTWQASIADPRVRGQYGVIFFLNVVLMGLASETGLFPIAWEGHLGGFVGGAIAYILLAPRQRGPWG